MPSSLPDHQGHTPSPQPGKRRKEKLSLAPGFHFDKQTMHHSRLASGKVLRSTKRGEAHTRRLNPLSLTSSLTWSKYSRLSGPLFLLSSYLPLPRCLTGIPIRASQTPALSLPPFSLLQFKATLSVQLINLNNNNMTPLPHLI